MADTQITRTVDRYAPHDEPMHLWYIATDGERVATLWVDTKTSEIANVWVREDRRGEGLATALYRQATSEQPVFHAPETHRTDEGNRWASIVGGPAIETCDCCAHLFDNDDNDDNDYDYDTEEYAA